ncbi:HlyD family type I secretion periplasmic adaptor subunit [Maritimibacter sp. DP1N21-5]|uniref:HlyD family type I secretion periplasmic adaptor subunit n=1 Tax=Maritimibacter sp. DP1N21-5 TaxID=2836867 RepID=UPI001C4591EC|nr:HlyD family type I secretion periplasmic adaptor subunit [Maritimibacter sp. DP1N21-5]MBV7407667.1 HlyD family type I secretion periplasmic adaptor subunit [Maritimibacter sp. DP1N21-5]
MSSARLPVTIDHQPAGAVAPWEASWEADVPRSILKHLIAGIVMIAVAFGGFGYWAFSAPLAAAIMAPGSFVATGRNKMVQHLEGGIIAEMHVAEGDKVRAGAPLLRLDETTALANQRALFLRRVRLEAIEARILSEYDAKPELVFPKWLEDARSDPEIATMLDSQALSFEVARSQLENDIGLIERNIAVLDSREEGYRIQRKAMERQIELLSEDRDAKAILLDRALIRRSDYNVLLRALAEADGQLGRIDAEISESIELRAKYEAQKRQAIDTYRQAALDELESVQIELDTVREQERDAQSTLRRVVIDAPVSGTVVRLNYAGVGGVVEAGKVIAEILPTDVPLIIETMIARTDIDSVKIGQQASVRLTALNARTTPILTGEVFYVSADAIVDDEGGQPREVYVARVKIPVEELDRIPGFAPVPGMPVLVMIQTAERTFVQYLVKPIADSMQRAFREQ